MCDNQTTSRRPPSRVMEIVLFSLGVVLAFVFCMSGMRSAFAMRNAKKYSAIGQANDGRPDRSHGSSKTLISSENEFTATYLSDLGAQLPTGKVVGQLRIDSLKLSAPIISGIANGDLSRGVGHVPGTSNAGGLGNMIVAGHRDSFFRPLRDVNRGMQVVIDTATGSYRYEVDGAKIVSPEQLDVLDIGDRPQLTMITCYPFTYIGAAPKRFVVFAHLVSVAPASR